MKRRGRREEPLWAYLFDPMPQAIDAAAWIKSYLSLSPIPNSQKQIFHSLHYLRLLLLSSCTVSVCMSWACTVRVRLFLSRYSLFLLCTVTACSCSILAMQIQQRIIIACSFRSNDVPKGSVRIDAFLLPFFSLSS